MLSLFAALALSAASNEPVVVDGVLCHPRRILVKMKDGVSPDRLILDGPLAASPPNPLSLNGKGRLSPNHSWKSSDSGARLVRWMPEIGWAVIELGQAGQLRSTLRRIRNDRFVAQATLDRAALPAYTPNDPRWPDQWGPAYIKVNLAWDLSLGSNAAIVAVIDTGVKRDHEDLAARIFVNTGEIPGNSIDDDNNGYVDDVNGWDFAYNDNDANDVFGHGTPCAGIVAATGDNSIGMSGMAPRARIVPIKACIDSGYFYDSFTVPAYIYCANLGVHVLSMSYFSDQVSPAERDAINYCWNHNVLPVAAAGNSSSVIPYYPGAYDNVLSVAAIGTNGNKAGFSNYGAWVDVAAPGTGLTATSNDGGYTTGFGGTSGATPHVAGLAALLKGARPSATNQELRYAIEDTATAVNQAPFGEYCNYGIVNSQAAMQAILGTPAPARTPVVRYVSALGNQPSDVFYDSEDALVSRIYGRGFQAPRTVTVTVAGQPLTVIAQTRDYIDVLFEPPLSGPFVVKVDGQTVSTITMPDTYRICYPMSEASTPSSSTTNGFLATLNADGVTMRCTRNGDGDIIAQMTFHRLQNANDLKLKIRRHYTSATGSSAEKIRVYDWSSASYPYGTFVDLSSGPCPTTATTAIFSLPNPSRFFDDEKTLYVVIEATNMPSGSELRVDQMIIESNR